MMQDTIREKIKELKTLDCTAKEIKTGEDWLSQGTKYSNQDFDVLQMLNTAIEKTQGKI